VNIGEASELCGLPAKTIRYYEDIGFVKPRRKESGYRQFDERQIKKLAFIRQARSLGFSVAECRELLALRNGQQVGSPHDGTTTETFLARIEEKVVQLETMRNLLHAAGRERSATPNSGVDAV